MNDLEDEEEQDFREYYLADKERLDKNMSEPINAIPESAPLVVRDNQTTAVGPALPTEAKSPVTAAQAKVEAIAELTHSAYARASQLSLTADEISKLQADFPDEAFQQGAAGKENLIYIEHAHLRDRMNQVFGPGQWAIIPRSRWHEDYRTSKGEEASRVYVEAMLLIRGCFVAEAVGDMSYHKNNASQNYGDAVEGAKTAAFRRCAKELGVGLQAWKKDWCNGWWDRRNERRDQKCANVSRAMSQRTPPAQPAPSNTPPEKVTPKVIKSHDEWLRDCLNHLVTELSGDSKADAWEYFYGKGWIMDNEQLSDASPSKVFSSTDPAKSRAENIEAVKKDHAQILKDILGVHPDASKPERKKSDFHPPWKDEIVPFGKDKDARFGDLDGKALWFWFMVWAAKPLEDFVAKNGKTYPPKEADLELWNLLNEHKAEAVAHYAFKPAKE